MSSKRANEPGMPGPRGVHHLLLAADLLGAASPGGMALNEQNRVGARPERSRRAVSCKAAASPETPIRREAATVLSDNHSGPGLRAMKKG